MPAETMPPACAATNLRMAARATTRLYDKALAPVGLTVTQYAILNNVAKFGEVATMSLASWLCLERTTLYRALAVLERRSLITSRCGHGREHILSLTPSGSALRDAALFHFNKVQTIFVEEFGEGWDEFLNKLGRARQIAADRLEQDSNK